MVSAVVVEVSQQSGVGSSEVVVGSIDGPREVLGSGEVGAGDVVVSTVVVSSLQEGRVGGERSDERSHGQAGESGSGEVDHFGGFVVRFARIQKKEPLERTESSKVGFLINY